MLDFDSVHVTYAGMSSEAVRGVSFGVPEGSFCGLVGESGSGKSTLVSAALGILPKGSRLTGQIRFRGRNIAALDEESLRRIRWRHMALVPQGAQNSFTPVKSIGAHMEEVLRIHCGMKGLEARRQIEALLDDVELSGETADRYPHELSGGQKQRAALALALACDPSLLLADEPTTALDVITQAEILKLLQRLRRERRLTILLVTHDLSVAASACTELFVMKDGLLREQGTPRQIFLAPRDPYTRRLVSSVL